MGTIRTQLAFRAVSAVVTTIASLAENARGASLAFLAGIRSWISRLDRKLLAKFLVFGEEVSLLENGYALFFFHLIVPPDLRHLA